MSSLIVSWSKTIIIWSTKRLEMGPCVLKLCYFKYIACWLKMAMVKNHFVLLFFENDVWKTAIYTSDIWKFLYACICNTDRPPNMSFDTSVVPFINHCFMTWHQLINMIVYWIWSYIHVDSNVGQNMIISVDYPEVGKDTTSLISCHSLTFDSAYWEIESLAYENLIIFSQFYKS